MPVARPPRPERPRAASEIAEAAWSRYQRLDERIVGTLRRLSLPLLRLSLGVVFVWFGALKVAGTTPVTDLVASTVYWVDPSWFVPLLGVFEVVVGAGLLIGRGLRLVLLLFAAQMLGTFLVLVFQPEVAFQNGNPLLLTTEGEFVVKNLVLLSGGLVVGSRLPRPRPWAPAADDDEVA
jgi:putative oxidoreductase